MKLVGKILMTKFMRYKKTKIKDFLNVELKKVLSEKRNCRICKKEFKFGEMYLCNTILKTKIVFICSKCWDLKNTESKI